MRILFYFLLALQFLTVIPVPVKNKLKPSHTDMARSTVFFPVVGLIIGALLFLIYVVFKNYLPLEATSVLILVGWVYFTGALHVDGFADTVDGVCGADDKKKSLAMMRDAHTGAKGVAGVVLLFLTKLFLIFSILISLRAEVLIYAPILGRWAMLAGAFILPYAREKGMGNFCSSLTIFHVIAAGIITLILGGLAGGVSFFVPFLGVGGFVLLFSLYLKKKIGGFTGDTLGALCEVGETVALFTACVVIA